MTEIIIPESVRFVLERLDVNGFEAYIVGGCVRDSLLGREVNDYDVTTNALPQSISEIFSDHKQVLSGIKHGTVGVIINCECVEITTYRIDGEYTDSRHPECVEFTSSIDNDLARRDFTVNAIAYGHGIFCDPYGGMADIEKRILRCVGNPAMRFEEDALRIMRLMRFSSVLGFDVEENTKRSALELYSSLEAISKERIYTELKKLLCGKNVYNVLTDFEPVIRFVLPSLNCDNETYIKSAQLAAKSESILPLRLALLYSFCNCTGCVCDLIVLKTDNEIRQNVKMLFDNRFSEKISLSDVRRLVGRYGAENASLIDRYNTILSGESSSFSDLLETIKEKRLCCTIKELDAGGRDIMDIVKNRENLIGVLLQQVLDAVIDGTIPNEKTSIIDYVKERVRAYGS